MWRVGGGRKACKKPSEWTREGFEKRVKNRTMNQVLTKGGIGCKKTMHLLREVTSGSKAQGDKFLGWERMILQLSQKRSGKRKVKQ